MSKNYVPIKISRHVGEQEPYGAFNLVKLIPNHGFAQHARGKLNSIRNLAKNGFHFFVIFNMEKRRKTTCSPTWRDIFMGTWAPTSFAELFCSFLLSKSSEKFSNVPSSDKCIRSGVLLLKMRFLTLP